MSEEEPEVMDRATAFWTIRNKILEDVRKHLPVKTEYWDDHNRFWLELSLLAAHGVCAKETEKVAAVLNDTLKEMQTVSKKLDEQIERLETGRAIGHTDGIDWDLVKDYFVEMKEVIE